MEMNSNKKVEGSKISNPRPQAARKDTVMKNLFSIVALVAIFAFASQAMAQATAPAAQAITLQDGEYLWKDSSDQFLPTRYALDMFFREGGGYFSRSQESINELVPTYVTGKNTTKRGKEAHSVLDPFAEVGFAAFTALTPVELVNGTKSAEAYLALFNCTLGVPDSLECQALEAETARIRDNLISRETDSERKSLAMGLRDNVSKNYIKNAEKNIPKTSYAKLALIDNAAIFALLERNWKALVLDASKTPGKEVTLSDLADRHGDHITVVCVGKETFWGNLNGETDESVLVLEKNGARETASAEDLKLCRFFLINGGAPSRCEQGKTAAGVGADFEGHKFLKKCPEDMKSLLGKEGLYFPEKCTDPIKVKVVETTSMGLVVTGPDGKKIMISCDDLAAGKVLFALPGKTIDSPPPTVGKLQLELVGVYFGNPGGVASNADGAMAAGAMARLVWTPWANEYIAIHGRLGLGGMKVFGLSPDAIDKLNDERGDLLSSLGLGMSVLFNNIFSMSIFGDVFFTTAGFGGGGGEVQFRFRLHPRVTLFFGPTLGYMISGVKPGSNHWFESCNEGPACKDMPDSTRFFYLGGVFGFGFDLISTEKVEEEEVRTAEPEAAEIQASASVE